MTAAVADAPQITIREIVEDVVDEIQRRRSARFDEDAEPYQRKNPIASDIDPDSCKRRQVFQIVKWNEAKPFDEYLKARFEIGKLLEREAGRELAALGFDVIHQQERFQLESRSSGEPVLSGKIDGKLELRAALIKIPFEVKSIHPVAYPKFNTIDDLYRHRYYRKYVFQMLAYLLGTGLECGFLWLTDCLGHWKAIVVEIDYMAAERVWQFAEDIVAAVWDYRNNKTLPDYTSDEGECKGCAFFGRSCQPVITEEGIFMYENGTLEAKLIEREELREDGRKYNAANNKIKKWLGQFSSDTKLADKDRVMIGDFLIEFAERHRRGYRVDAKDYRQAKITRINPGSSRLNPAHR